MAVLKQMTQVKRKRGRPKKRTVETQDYRLKTISDSRLLAMKQKLAEMEPGTTQWETARREYFAALLDHKLDVETRADLLVALAMKDDAKSAPIALRALQDINTATRVSDPGNAGMPSIFVLPPGTAVAIKPADVIETTAVPVASIGPGEPDEPYEDNSERW